MPSVGSDGRTVNAFTMIRNAKQRSGNGPWAVWAAVLGLGIWGAPAFAQQTAREIRESANAKLAQGAYGEAIGDLQALIEILGPSKRSDVRAGLEHIYFSLGLCHLFSGDFPVAADAFKKYISLYPSGARVTDAWVYLGDAQRFAGKSGEALRTYTEALKRYPYGFDLRTDLHAGIARCHLAEGRWAEAIPALYQTYSAAPDSLRRSWAATLLATAYLKTADLEKLYPLTPVLLAKGSFAGRSVVFNLAALEAGDLLFAEERYREALWIHRLVFPHGEVSARGNEYLETLRKRAEFEQRRPGDPRVLMRLQESLGELEAELEALEGIDNYDVELAYRIARGYREQSRFREACELFLHLHTVAERELADESLHLAFQCAAQVPPRARAYRIAATYMEKYPDGEWFDPLTLAAAQLRAGEENWPAVIELLTRALEIRPDHGLEADCRYLLGYACFMEERFTEATGHLWRLREGFPEHDLVDAAVYWTGLAELFRTEYAAAAAEFDELSQRFPASRYQEDGVFRRAVCSYGLGDFEEAGERLDRFLARFPQSRLAAEAAMTRADVAGALGEIDTAVRLYGQALEGGGLNIEHYNHSAFQACAILVDAGRHAEAKALLQRYAERNREGSNLPLAAYWIGQCFLALEGEGAALAYYQDAMTELGRDRSLVGVDMILDEWIGLARRLGGEAASRAWQRLQRSLRDALHAGDRTTTLRLQRMLMHHPSLVEADRERVRAELLRAENLPFASPAVLQHVLDEAAERGLHELARAAAGQLVADFPETDCALDARMALARYAITAAEAMPPGSDQAAERRAEAVRQLTIVREVHAASGEAGQALLLLGALHQQQRKFQEAEAAYRDVLGVKEWRALWPEALYGRGMNAMLSRKYLEACAYFERIYVLYAGHTAWAAKAYLRRAECLERLSERAKAVETLRELLAHPLAGSQPEEAAAARALLESLGESA